MRRIVWTARLIGLSIAGLALVGCGGSSEPTPQTVPITPSTEEDAEQTQAFAQQRVEWEAQAQQGDPRSQRQLGIMYYLGQGMDVDYATAYEWLSKAANQRDDVAQLTLGVMYNEGQGVPKSRINAHMWLSLAAQQGNPSAKIRLGNLEPQMSPEEITEARGLAARWTPAPEGSDASSGGAADVARQ